MNGEWEKASWQLVRVRLVGEWGMYDAHYNMRYVLMEREEGEPCAGRMDVLTYHLLTQLST